MPRLVVIFMVIGLIWVGSAGATARQDALSVVPSAATTDSELARLFPVSIDGRPVVVEAWSGAQWVAQFDAEVSEAATTISAAESLLAEAGIDLDQMEVASASVDLGEDAEVAITAVRVQGSRAYDIIDAAVGAVVPGTADPALGWSWAGDAWIAFYVRQSAADDSLVVAYPAADTVWIIDAQVEGDVPIAEHVEPVIEALPTQSGVIGPIVETPQRVEAPVLGIAASFPEGWVVETLPVTADEQAVIDRSAGRFEIDAEWKGTIRAVGPVHPGLREAPMCHLMVFEQRELTPRAWIAAVTEGDPFYLVDETPAGLVRARIRPSDGGREWAPSQGGVEHFALARGDEIAYLNCWSTEPPGERGSAIARTIEFLPTGE